MNEKELVKACQNGDKYAFEELIRQFYPYVTGFLLKNTANETLSEDLCQETFLKMIRNIEKYNIDSSTSFGTWLITIAKNTLIDYLRKNRIVCTDFENLHVQDERDIETQTVMKLQFEEAMEIINSLPPEQGIAIKLKYIENMTLSQIAERFGVEPKTIKSRIHEGTIKLRKKLMKKGLDVEYE